jgi:hypothetical protein
VKLTDFGHDEYSQFGEDGIIQHVFDKIGTRSKFCVEFGAADGKMCSNTKWLRDGYDWSALLIEADSDRFENLMSEFRPGVQCIHAMVTPENINHYIAGRQVDFMSIDVDGDYAIFEGLECRPRLVCIEYNATIPPTVTLRQSRLGEQFGSSAASMIDLARSRGYELIGLTRGNLFFVLQEDIHWFAKYERDLDKLFDRSWLTYVATDYDGHPVIVGDGQWGLKSTPFLGETTGSPVAPYSRRVEVLVDALEEKYRIEVRVLSPKLELPVQIPDTRREVSLRQSLRRGWIHVIPITDHALDANFDWMLPIAEAAGFECKIIPSGIIALIPRSA